VVLTARIEDPLFSIPATGKRVSWNIIDIMTIQNGKVTEHWVVADVLSLMQQLGAVPQ
jgi:predicted ester cyclase